MRKEFWWAAALSLLVHAGLTLVPWPQASPRPGDSRVRELDVALVFPEGNDRPSPAQEIIETAQPRRRADLERPPRLRPGPEAGRAAGERPRRRMASRKRIERPHPALRLSSSIPSPDRLVGFESGHQPPKPSGIAADERKAAEASRLSQMRPNLGADPMPEARVGPTGPAAAESVSIRRAIPRYDLNPPPSYPEVARRRGYEGTVLLAVRVRKDGGVAAAQIAETSGYEVLDRAAVRAVRAWRFRPARRGEEPVEMEVRVPVRFQLQ